MLATIVLPQGTDRVYVRDIPRLFADAIHPPVQEDTPRLLSYLQKEATTEEKANEWCGFGNNFPISLTALDLDGLNRGVWAALPPLELLPENNEGPTKLKTYLTEPQWEPYRLAFEASPPEGWTLIAVWRNTVIEQWLMNHEAQKQWKQLVAQHAVGGTLAPRPQSSYIPTAGLIGRQLEESFLSVPELTEYAAQFSVAVRVRREFTRKPLASALLVQLRDVPPDEPVLVHEAMGNFSGQSVARACEFVEELERVVARQENGFFTVAEAARLLVDANPGLSVKDLIERMSTAMVGSIEARRHLVRSADLMPLTEGDTFREYMDIVTVEEVDEWLARSMGVPYRLGPLVPHLSAFPSGKHLPTDVRYEVPLHDYLQPKTPWKGGRMAQDEALPLREAARLASRHARQDITELDFLRAGARGEIHVRVIVPRTVTMLPVRPSEQPIALRKGALREIPPQVCEALSITGTAHWRELEAREPVEAMEGRVCRFVCWRLAPGDDDLVSTASECVVMGWDVHALADAMLEHAAPAAAIAPALTVERSDASPPVTVVKEVQPTGPVFSMTRAALVTRHEHHWPTIQSDLKNASTNGLAQAKAGTRDWNESLALEWARANNKLAEEAPASADPLAQAMRNLSALPGRKNVLKG